MNSSTSTTASSNFTNNATSIKVMKNESSLTTGKNVAKVAFAVFGTTAVGVTLISASFLSPALRRYCLPYIPATPQQIENVLTSLRFCSSISSSSSSSTSNAAKAALGPVVDLGSGDGRIVSRHLFHWFRSLCVCFLGLANLVCL